MKTRRVGEVGENLAEKYLRKHGYRIIERNFSTRFGEIDLIAKKKGVLVFVEVKARLGFGRPEWSIDQKKIGKVKKMAECYLVTEQPKHKNLRIDAVCIDLNTDVKAEDIRHYENMTLDI
jgi:putative endonuclease